MDLILLLLNIALVGFLVWIITQIPMPQLFKTIIYVITAIAVLFFLLHRFGGTLPMVLHAL